MGRNRLKSRQKMNLSFRMRMIIGASVLAVSSFILIIIFHMGDVKDSNAFTTGAYRSVASGNWDDANVWEVYDGTIWRPADIPPGEDGKNVTISSGQRMVLSDEIELNNLVIEKGARLEITGNNMKLTKQGGNDGLICNGELAMGDAIIEGTGDFQVGREAVLFIGSDAGIDKKSSTGNIQTKGKKDFHKDATFVFNGSIFQHSGNGLPAVINKLIIDNRSGVELDQHLHVTGKLELKKGVLNTSKFHLQLGSSPTNISQLIQEEGALQGRVKCWYGTSNIDNLEFLLSDGKTQKKFIFKVDVASYKKGLLELIYEEGFPDDSKKSPYEARHVVIGLFEEGYYSASLSNGPDEAWLKFVSSQPGPRQIETITWNISSQNSKNIIEKSGMENSDHDSNKSFSNLIIGPNPFKNVLVVRFHSESGGMVHLALVNREGRVISNEKVNAISGYNQIIIEPGNDIPVGDYMIQLSNISEIQTIKATKAPLQNGNS